MGFEGLLGNDQLKENLRNSLQSGHISHFYLISGPEGSGKHTLAKLLAAAILCQGQKKPCLSCHPCRKVIENNHPDLITIVDPEHKTVPVKVVRQMREDMFILPNESDHKIYLLPQELGIEGQNALLKILEEPPSYGVFILLTDNPERLLPTVRSRCTQLQLRPLPETVLKNALQQAFPQADAQDIDAAIDRCGGFLGQAKTLLEEGSTTLPQTVEFSAAYSAKDALALTKLLASMEKCKRDQLIPLLEQWVQLLQGALSYRNGIRVLSPAAREIGSRRNPSELMHGITQLKTAISYAQGNISPAAICGWLSWELR